MFDNERRILKKYELIDQLAYEIRKAMHIETPINDIDQIVEYFGGTVVVDSNKHMNIGIEKTSNKTFNLYVPECRREEDRKFYVAQQLGRFFLHTNYLADDNVYYESDEFVFKNKNDYSCNYVFEENFFGGAFLMPYEEYKNQIKLNCENGIVHTDKVAEHFGVTTGTASWRGKQLGLLKD